MHRLVTLKNFCTSRILQIVAARVPHEMTNCSLLLSHGASTKSSKSVFVPPSTGGTLAGDTFVGNDDRLVPFRMLHVEEGRVRVYAYGVCMSSLDFGDR